ncbi:MAG TPA: LON peptidase substrate-binding domain-containing protein [Caulobacteraceae bacterium]|nr:LON peptidase substrate-binding domain-containing protein [Caulobacteraceae bacterium]
MPGYSKAEDLPRVLPVFPLDGALLLPGGRLPLNIFEPRYLNMIDDALSGERLIGMIQTRAGGPREHPALAPVGCAGRITAFSETDDGRYLITLTGVCRFKAGEELPVQTPYRQVRPNFEAYESDLAPADAGALLDRTMFFDVLKAYLDCKGLEIDWESARQAPPDALINSLAIGLPFDAAEKQALLEAYSLADRRDALIALLQIDAAAIDPDDEPSSLQ